MKNLKNLKVKDRLVRSFLFVTILGSIAGLLGAVLILVMDARYTTALELNGFIQGDLGEYNSYLNKGGAYVRDVIMLDDAAEVASAKESLAESDEMVDFYLAEFSDKLENDEERAFLADINEN